MTAVKQDTRKPEQEIRITEVANVTANIQRNIDNLDDWMKPVDVVPSMNPNDTANIVLEARGVCLILGPWNFPLGLVLGPLAAAIAAGNCCMVKLTDLCPATASVAATIIREAFAENEVALFEGDVGVATVLLEFTVQPYIFYWQHASRQTGHGGCRETSRQRHPRVGRQVAGYCGPGCGCTKNCRRSGRSQTV